MNKTYFFNYIRFYKWGIGFNTSKLKCRLSAFIIKRKSKFLDEYFLKRSSHYYETFNDFYDTRHGGSPEYRRIRIHHQHMGDRDE